MSKSHKPCSGRVLHTVAKGVLRITPLGWAALLSSSFMGCGGTEDLADGESEASLLRYSIARLVNKATGVGVDLRDQNFVVRMCKFGKTRPCPLLGSAPSTLPRTGRHAEVPYSGRKNGYITGFSDPFPADAWHYAEFYVKGFQPKILYFQGEVIRRLTKGFPFRKVKLMPKPRGLDFNGDGKADYQCHQSRSAQGGGRNTIALTGENGELISKSGGVFCQNPNRSLRFGDFSGDGKTDYVCTNGDWHRVAVSRGDGRFALKNDFNWCDTDNAELRFGDFNGDGRTDLQCHDVRQLPGDPPLRNRVALSRGNGSFNKMSGQPWCPNGQFDLADFNADGRTDYHCHSPASDQNWIALSQGNGTFKTVPVDPNPDGQPKPWCNTQANDLRLFDFNGDDRADYVCSHKRYKRITVRLNQGGGAFGPNQVTKWCTRSADGSAFAELKFADFNGDGNTDLLCHYQADESNRIALADGHGRFDVQAPRSRCTVDGARLSLADFNGDGKNGLSMPSPSKRPKWCRVRQLGF